MKKFLLLGSILSFLSLPLMSQTIQDAFLLSQQNLSGTARYHAMGGAFNALGGDYTVISENPAASAIFIENGVSVSLNVIDSENTSTYNGGIALDTYTATPVNQAAGVWLFYDDREDAKWKKFSLAFTFNQTQDLNQNIFISGNSNLSIDAFFLEQANGIPLDLLQLRTGETEADLYRFLGETQGTRAQNAFLAYQAFIIDPVENNPNNTNYITTLAGNNFSHDVFQQQRGYINKYTFNFGAQYTENLFIGVNLNSHEISYFESHFLRERIQDPQSTLSEIGFENNLSTTGSGFSFNLGAIYKLSDAFRFGFSYQSPTWHTLLDETTQYIESEGQRNGNPISIALDPNIINVFPEYRFQTPGKIATGLAYVIGNTGLLSIDYNYTDFSKIRFRPKSDITFANLNTSISNVFQPVHQVKIGAETRLYPLSFRGGLQYTTSPFQNQTLMPETVQYSGGIGYAFDTFTLDLAYSFLKQEQSQALHPSEFTNRATLNNQTQQFLITLTTKL